MRPLDTRIETAIFEHRRVRRLRLPSDRAASRGEELRIWPLQLMFSGGLWHLAWEEDTIGRPHGLLQCERLEQLQFLQAEPRGRRNESDHNAAIVRLERRLHHCGGTELGDDSATQEGLCQPSTEQRRRQLQTLRFSCKPGAYVRIREGQLPLPLGQIRVARETISSAQQPAGNGTGQGWIHPALAQVLPPNPPQAQLGGVGLADEQVAVELHLGDIAQLTARVSLAATATTGSEDHALLLLFEKASPTQKPAARASSSAS